MSVIPRLTSWPVYVWSFNMAHVVIHGLRGKGGFMSIPASGELSVRSESIQRVYGYYLADRFIVNRRYQRKLVWSVEEKQRLIDSILRDMPIPMFLVAEIGATADAQFELIDGMQRLNAIFSFLENEFPVGGEYFDLDALADTKLLKDKGVLSQRTPVMSREKSVQLANYTIALSVFRTATSASVDDVFRRINSGGRRLSRQELRQAGTTSALADLVRIISSNIRTDTSPRDIVPLRMMPQLSITNRDLNYGVLVDDIFWVKQGILRREDVRESLDEQVVLDLIIDCLIDPIPNTGTRTRDAYYNFTDLGAADEIPTRESLEITQAIESYGRDKFQNDFMRTYDTLREILDQQDKRFSVLVGAGSGGRSPRYFHAVFIAIYELLIRDRMRLRDAKQAAVKLSNIGKEALSIPAGGGDWIRDAKRKSIDAVKGVLRSSFEPVSTHEDFSRYGWASELETILSNALVEQQLFECKQGFLSLGHSREFDEASFSKIMRTATAMANHGPGVRGHIAIGIADNKSDAERVAALDNVSVEVYKNFYIVGIDREAELLKRDLNEYWAWLMQRISSNTKLNPGLAKSIAADSRLISYRGKAIILLRVKGQQSPVFYDKTLVERSGSETVEVDQSDYMRIFGRFTSR